MTNTQNVSARAATAQRAGTFTESVIREMTRVANQYGAINLAQGFPDFPMPEPMKDAACAAIHGDINQYAITWGSPALRIAIPTSTVTGTTWKSTPSARSLCAAGRRRRWLRYFSH